MYPRVSKVTGTLALAFVIVQISTTLASSPWPCFLHDSRHTGQSDIQVLNTPGLLWTYATGAVISSSPVVGEEGRIYFGSYDGKLIACQSDGELLWSFQAGAEIDNTPALRDDGKIIFGCVDGFVYAINPDGTLAWQYQTGGSIRRSSPIIAGDGTIIVGTLGFRLVALQPDGSLRWQVNLGGAIWSSPAIFENTVYVGCDNNKLFAIALADGSIIRTYETDKPIRTTIVVGNEGNVFFATTNGDLICLDPTGNRLWVNEMQGEVVYSSPALSSEGILYIGSSAGFHAIKALDGIKVWEWRAGMQFRGAPAIDAEGRIYSGAEDGKLYAFTKEGNTLWSFATEDLIASAPAIGLEGRLYFGSYDRKLYALAQATPTPTVTTTPTSTVTFTPTVTPVPKLPPLIMAAGYMNSSIDRELGGTFSMVAWVEDQDGDSITSVDILFNGAKVAELPLSPYPDIYMITDAAVSAGMIDGEYYLQLVAQDSSGMSSDPWPEITIHPMQSQQSRKQWSRGTAATFLRLLQAEAHPARPRMTDSVSDAPRILGAGFMNTTLISNQPIDFTFIAFMDDPQGIGDITAVDVYYGHEPAGLRLYDDGNNNDMSAGDGVFALTYQGAVLDSGYEGSYRLELVARDQAGNQSSFFPYLTVRR